jgi:hypothetical protein
MGKVEEQQHASLLKVISAGEIFLAEDGTLVPEHLDEMVCYDAHWVMRMA